MNLEIVLQRQFTVTSLLILLLGVATLCPAAEAQIIIDARGQSKEIATPVRRLVSLNADALEVVRLLGASELVAGVNGWVSRNGAFWPELKKRPVAGGWNQPNYEQIVTLTPDLVLTYGRNPGLELEAKLERLGIRVLRLDFYKTSTLVREVEALGRLLDREQQARAFTNWHLQGLAKIKRLTAMADHRPRVYIENYSPYKTLAPGSGGAEMAELAGGDNIASHLAIPYPEITSEWVLSQDPEIIVKISSVANCYGADQRKHLAKVREEIMARPGWNRLTAVRQGRVYVMAGPVGSGPSGLVGIAYLASWFYPNLATDLDPRELHRQYLEYFQKIPFQGHYVFPEGDK
jgi:iron complex transport system substrate-binding protein